MTCLVAGVGYVWGGFVPVHALTLPDSFTITGRPSLRGSCIPVPVLSTIQYANAADFTMVVHDIHTRLRKSSRIPQGCTRGEDCKRGQDALVGVLTREGKQVCYDYFQSRANGYRICKLNSRSELKFATYSWHCLPHIRPIPLSAAHRSFSGFAATSRDDVALVSGHKRPTFEYLLFSLFLFSHTLKPLSIVHNCS